MLEQTYLEDLLNNLKIELIKEIAGSKLEVMKKVTELEESLKNINFLYEESKKKITNLEQKGITLEKKVEALTLENCSLKNDLMSVRDDVTELQQRTRVQNIEIAGFPETPRENLFQVLNDIAETINVDFHPNDVNVVHRTKTHRKGVPRPIVVNFYARGAKKEWISKAKERGTLNAKEIHRNLPDSRIFIGEHLCPANKKLLSKARQAASVMAPEERWQYVWPYDGKIYARKATGQPSYQIRGDMDIDKFFCKPKS